MLNFSFLIFRSARSIDRKQFLAVVLARTAAAANSADSKSHERGRRQYGSNRGAAAATAACCGSKHTHTRACARAKGKAVCVLRH